MSDPIRVLITGAAGQIAYSLLFPVCNGDVFGKNQPIDLLLLDIAPMMGVLEGVVMEIRDCAFPLVREIKPTADHQVAFDRIDAAMLVGAMPRREGMERKDLLAANVKIFKEQGQSLAKYAKKEVKVVVVGNPANTNALICAKYAAPTIPKENFTCLTRLDQHRAMYQISNKVRGAQAQDVKNVVIWGNHSSTQFPDVRNAAVKGTAVCPAVNDDSWVKHDFISCVQQRGAAVIKARKLSSAMSAAKATADHMHDWWHGTKEGEWVSMGVCSDGNPYGIQEGLVYSFPVRIQNGQWSVVPGLPIDDFAREKMTISQNELIEERDAALKACQD